MKSTTHIYKLAVEGDTEKWYFKHLEKLVNEYCCRNSIPKQFEIKCSKAGQFKACVKKARKLKTGLATNPVYAVFDSESISEEEAYKEAIIEAAKKPIVYCASTSSSFDLWIILHKKKLTRSVVSPDDYLSDINDAYSERFPSMQKYKEHDNFGKVLKKITLDDVKFAIKNVNEIRERNKRVGTIVLKYGGDTYYKNPDVKIDKIVLDVFNEIGKSILK